MKPLILTISGYLLIITFIIFALLLSISLDASLWGSFMQYAVIINCGSNAEILLKGKNILLFVGVWENF